MERRPMSTWLTWDLGELDWKVSSQDKINQVSFFKYSVKIGWKLLFARSRRKKWQVFFVEEMAFLHNSSSIF